MSQNPAPIITDGLALITQRLKPSNSARAAEITLAFKDTSAQSAGTIANLFSGGFQARFQSQIADYVTIEPPYVVRGNGSRTPQVALSTVAAVVGTYSGTFVTPQVCALLRKTTNLGGKSNRGRTYLPFCLKEGDVDDAGHVLTARVTSLSTVAGQLMSDMFGVDLVLCIANKLLAPSVVKPGTRFVDRIIAGEDVTSWTCEDICATQRRRLARS